MNKTITKTLIASVLIIALAVSFAACGGKTDPDTSTQDNTTTTKKEAENKSENTTTTKKKLSNVTTTKKQGNTTTTKKQSNTTTTKKSSNTTTTKKNNTEPGTQAKRVRIMDWCTYPGITNVDDGSNEYSEKGYEFPKKYTADYNSILSDMEDRGYCTTAERDARRQPNEPGTGGVATTGDGPGFQF